MSALWAGNGKHPTPIRFGFAYDRWGGQPPRRKPVRLTLRFSQRPGELPFGYSKEHYGPCRTGVFPCRTTPVAGRKLQFHDTVGSGVLQKSSVVKKNFTPNHLSSRYWWWWYGAEGSAARKRSGCSSASGRKFEVKILCTVPCGVAWGKEMWPR